MSKFLEEGKNPGLGIKDLHDQGVDGSGITVAIIDQKLRLDHVEYKNCIKSYIEYGSAMTEPFSMHGPAVASLFVGKTCGVASGADLFYYATPSGRDFSWRAAALRDIAERNQNLKEKNKIKIISSSIGYRIEVNEPGLSDYIEAISEATKAGMIFLDANDGFGINFIGGGSIVDKENIETYSAWDINNPVANLVVPTDYRTFASPNGSSEFAYEEKGGISWGIPFLSGLFAMALQINPMLSGWEISEIIKNTAKMNKKGFLIVNPTGIIAEAKEAKC